MSEASHRSDEVPQLPVVVDLTGELALGLDAEQAFTRLSTLPHCLFLDSARRDAVLGRYSFIAADPVDFVDIPADGSDPLAELARRMQPFSAQAVPGLPPFQGGAAGVWSYDLNRSLERVAVPRYGAFATSALAVGLYDVVVAFDHAERRAWIISQGFPELEPANRLKRARQRAAQMHAWLKREVRRTGTNEASTTEPPQQVSLPPLFDVPGPVGLKSDFSREAYLAAVQRAIEYIRAGDIFQVNLSQRLFFPAHDSAVELYLRLRTRNPAPFAGYFDAGTFQIASASPERFLQLAGREIETRPIKGTRQRTRRPEADLFAGDDLEQSEKDRAENVMIVDLLRNDLARVCLADSVRVTQLCRLESYEFVQHLVSAVRGTLRPECGPIDLLRATFPGGSITGAPKVRAMNIIAELEPSARGPYCGALGYLGFDGTLDTNILIRTFTAAHGWWQAGVGGGIVAQSHPEREYEETWHKAAGLLRALR